MFVKAAPVMLAFILAFILVDLGCCAGTAWAKPVRVVATTSILMDMIRNVGGGDVQVTSLVPPDGDAHVYEPKPSDVQAIAEAQLVVDNGLGLEPWLSRLIEAAEYRGARATATKGIEPLTMREGGRNIDDPHAWQDLANGRLYVETIAQALAGLDATHADAYRKRAATYEAALADLDRKTRTTLARIPPGRRRVITTHDAFQYYGRAYGVAFIAPLGLSTEEDEPLAANLGRLETQIRAQHIKALFFENMTDRRLMDQLASDTGAAIGPPLYSDALSKPDGPASTYVEMFTYNTANLAAGMQQN